MPTDIERIEQLERIVGVFRYTADRLGVAEWTEAKKEVPLERSGDRNVYDRMREIGISQDFLVEVAMPELRAALSTATQRIAQLESRIAALESRAPQEPPRNAEIPDDLRSALEAIGAQFNSRGTLKAFKFAEYGNPEGDMYGYTGVDDAAYRQFSGIREKIGGSWPSVDQVSGLPVVMYAIERDGGISWDFSPPLLAEQPNPHPFKTFLMYLAGFRRGVGPRGPNDIGPYMDFGSFESGRGIRWFVRRPGSQSPDTEVVIQMDAQGLAVRVGDGLRRVRMRPDGSLYATDPIIEDQ